MAAGRKTLRSREAFSDYTPFVGKISSVDSTGGLAARKDHRGSEPSSSPSRHDLTQQTR